MPTKISRSEFLKSAAASFATIATLPFQSKKLLPSMAVFAPAGQETAGDVLVVVFQRGGMDALNAVIPHAESAYYDQRPTLAIPEPSSGEDNAGIDLDGFFSLHPALRGLKDIWDEQDLAIIHAVGSPDPTHSHFEAMEFMERGTPGEKSISSGWLARHLETAAWENQSPFRAVGIGSMLQSALRGPITATTLKSISDFHLGRNETSDALAQFQQSITQLYRLGGDLDPNAATTLSAAEILRSINANGYTPANNAEYPDTDFGQGLLQIAQMIKAEIGLEVAAIDIGGWDTHAAQGALDGDLPGLLLDFGDSLAAFYHDLGDLTQRVTVVTMSEFGRRVAENGSTGTDHGHGGVMFAIGKNVNGGQVFGAWPGLAPENLYGPGDLNSTTDYRDILSEVLQKRMRNDNLDYIFPSHSDPINLGVFKG